MRHKLKPKTLLSYQCYAANDLIPALGALRLEHQHVAQFIAAMEAAGRGAPTIRRCVAVLSSALADAVERRQAPPQRRETRSPAP